MISAEDLIAQVRAYNPKSDSELLRRAYAIGAAAHAHQTRADGRTPYFSHPLAAAQILVRYRLDDATIAAAMLHDVIEDTPTPESEILDACGPDVLRIVHGVTKVGKIADIRKKALRDSAAKAGPGGGAGGAAGVPAQAPAAPPDEFERASAKQVAQAENLRKLILAMAEDARVLLVKLADRQHNMSTLGNLRPDKQERIARETLEIYAPLAGRMGMQEMREELEDACFQILNPAGRQSILKRLAQMRREHGGGSASAQQVIGSVRDALEVEMGKARIGGARTEGRMKRPYSIWRKLQDKRLDPDHGFQQLSDVIAFRVIVPTPEDCYRALGAIHLRWPVVMGRLKDYISVPKANGYKSLHTTVMMTDLDDAQRVEVQIRTEDMHEWAETGVAAHWSYKDGVSNAQRFKVNPSSWLTEVADELGAKTAQEAQDALANARMEFYHDRVFCFTPKGEVKRLPMGATLLDFAYAVHTDVGDTCVGGEINGLRSALSARLRNGDVVEIRRSENQRPEPWWESIVKTGRARSAVRRALEAQELAKAAVAGELILRHAYRSAGLEYDARDVDVAAARFQMERQALLADVGRWDAREAPNHVSANRVLSFMHPGHAPKPTKAQDERPGVPVRFRDGQSVMRRGVLKLAQCCRPVPGDKLLAIPHAEGGFLAHRRECPVVAADEENAEQWREVEWELGEEHFADHVAALRMKLLNTPGALAQVCQILADQDANIDDLRLAERTAGVYDFRVNVEVRSSRHLAAIIGGLESAEPVDFVERVMEESGEKPSSSAAAS